MCDCPEIQKFRYDGKAYFGWKAGDWYILARPKYLERIAPLIWSEYLDFGRFKKEGELLIWLPRQDQIQEMMPWHEPDRVHQWLLKFFYFLTNEIGIDVSIFTTAEQLWLAFYMYECHKKIWRNDKWSG